MAMKRELVAKPSAAAELVALANFRCCGCGKESPDNIKPCECATGIGYRQGNGKFEHVVFKTVEGAALEKLADQIEGAGHVGIHTKNHANVWYLSAEQRGLIIGALRLAAQPT